MSIAVRHVSGAFGAALVLFAQSVSRADLPDPVDLPYSTEREIEETLRGMIQDAQNQIKPITVSGNNIELTTHSVRDESGLPCINLGCPKPFREFDIEYDGQYKGYDNILIKYSGEAHYQGRDSWALRNFKITREPVLPKTIVQPAPAPAPVTTTIVQQKPQPAPAKPAYSRAKAVLVQKSLEDLYYYTGKIDGDFGSGSQSALADFFKDEDLALATSPVDDELLDTALSLLEIAKNRQAF